MSFEFDERPGNVLENIPDSDRFGIVVCVSHDFRSTTGTASMVRHQFGGVEQLRSQNKKVGEVAHLSRDNCHIFYLITKPNVYTRSVCYDTVRQCLKELRKACIQFDVSRLALAGRDFQEKHLKDCLFTAFEGWQGEMTLFAS